MPHYSYQPPSHPKDPRNGSCPSFSDNKTPCKGHNSCAAVATILGEMGARCYKKRCFKRICNGASTCVSRITYPYTHSPASHTPSMKADNINSPTIQRRTGRKPCRGCAHRFVHKGQYEIVKIPVLVLRLRQHAFSGRPHPARPQRASLLLHRHARQGPPRPWKRRVRTTAGGIVIFVLWHR